MPPELLLLFFFCPPNICKAHNVTSQTESRGAGSCYIVLEKY